MSNKDVSLRSWTHHPALLGFFVIVAPSINVYYYVLLTYVLTHCCLGVIRIGVSVDEPSQQFSTAARNTLLATTGVDVRSIAYRWKFVFVAQIGSPQKAQYEVRDHTGPAAIAMDVLLRGHRCIFE